MFSFLTYLHLIARHTGRVFIKVHAVRKLFKELMEMDKQQTRLQPYIITSSIPHHMKNELQVINHRNLYIKKQWKFKNPYEFLL